jgi:ribonuclease P protein component
MRLGRSRRLRKGPEFERVFKEGAALGGPLFVLRVAPNQAGYVRWGFAAGRKAFSDAVSRNRARRRLKAAVQVLAPVGAADVVIIARPEAATCDFAWLVAELARRLRRAGLEVAGQ